MKGRETLGRGLREICRDRLHQAERQVENLKAENHKLQADIDWMDEVHRLRVRELEDVAERLESALRAARNKITRLRTKLHEARNGR